MLTSLDINTLHTRLLEKGLEPQDTRRPDTKAEKKKVPGGIGSICWSNSGGDAQYCLSQ